MADKKLYDLYGLGMKLTGYERSIAGFLQTLDIPASSESNILDAGCGTGIVGLTLLQRFGGSSLLSTDIDDRFLGQVIDNAMQYNGVDSSKVTVGLSDVSTPHEVTLHDARTMSLPEEYFDIVSIGASLGYAKDQKEALRTILGLIKPGGQFINLEMNEDLIGRYVSRRYQYPVIPISEMIAIIGSEGYSVETIPLSLRHFPANLTRVGIVAQKNIDMYLRS